MCIRDSHQSVSSQFHMEHSSSSPVFHGVCTQFSRLQPAADVYKRQTLSSASGMYMYETDVTAIHINIPAASSYVTGEMSRRNGLLVHEGQHAVLALKTNFSSSGKYMWLNEGPVSYTHLQNHFAAYCCNCSCTSL